MGKVIDEKSEKTEKEVRKLKKLEAFNSAFLQLLSELGNNQTILNISLGGNKCGYFGALELSKALRMNSTLKILQLKGFLYLFSYLLEESDIEPSGLKEICESLKTNNSLTYINLDGRFQVEF